MNDIEKVKQGLKAHTDECAWVCNEICPHYEPSEYGCCDKLIEDALSVIEEQQAEIERLEKENGTLKLAVQSMPNWLDEKRPEVVRCKDCTIRDKRTKVCPTLQFSVPDTFFCGFGERKDGDGE